MSGSLVLLKHTLEGEKLVAMVPHLDEASKIIRHQEEWFSGGGYPDGIQGEKIPLGSRILAVVKTYDRLLGGDDDMYPSTRQKALGPILKESGTLYDNDVVSTFRSVLMDRSESGDGSSRAGVRAESKDKQVGG